jgi:hypothetical protein
MAEILKHIIVKLFGIVDYDFSQDIEMIDDVLVEKLLNCRGFDIGIWLCLNPLDKILDCYDGDGVIALRWS